MCVYVSVGLFGNLQLKATLSTIYNFATEEMCERDHRAQLWRRVVVKHEYIHDAEKS